VWALDDINGNNGVDGFSPDGGALLDFQFDLDFSLPPSNNTSPGENLQSSLTNLFYWNNIIHDVFYRYGFDEPSGNFQQNNYGNGGAGGDFIYADGLDGSDTNNARFYTSPDGINGRMEMYLWTGGGAMTTFEVNSPSGIAGSYNVGSASFGPSTFNVTGDLVIAEDGTGTGSDACTALTNGAAINGNIALIDRGSCEFGLKVLNAENAGAVAAIICNNVPGAPITMGGGVNGGSVTIPSVMLSQSDCNTIRTHIPTVNVTMTGSPNPSQFDGSYDNGIVAHEYAHGISNRLTGGPATSGCLGNAEQGGEGWSDFFGLVLTHEAGDDRDTPRGIGTYATGQGVSGGGIRTYPYTADMGVNPFTYDDIKTQSIPHGVGSVLCTMLWDMYWDLVDLYGYDSDLYTGTGGNNMAIQLVMDGLKLQPCSPGFTDVRDAILLADEINYNGANQCLIWGAFARRGLGYSADQGVSSSRSDGTEAYDLPADIRIDESISISEGYEGEVLSILTSATCGCTDKNMVEFKHTIPSGLSVLSVSQGSLSGNEISRTSSTLVASTTLDIEYEARIDLCNPDTETIYVQEGAEGTNLFTSATITTSGNWVTSTSEANSGSSSWYAEDYDVSSDYGLSLVTPVSITGVTLLEFYHKYETEATWDGGVVEIFSGGNWIDLGDKFLINGYPSSFASNGSSPLAGRSAFTGTSSSQLGAGFVKSVVDLSSYAGETINIRFRFATDNNTNVSGLNGWFVDDITIRQIPAVTIDATVTSSLGTEDTDDYTIEIKDLNQSTLYVDELTTGARYGGDWPNAFVSLQDALSIADCNVSVTEIWVKSGEYYPTEGMDQTISFELKDGLAIYGGFNGGETLLSQRNIASNPTILSGNIGSSGDDTDNSDHVVKAENVNATAILDGFTIKDGYVTSADGAGLLNSNSSAEFRNCTFSNNYSGMGGGAVSNENISSSTFTDCAFDNNSSTGNGGAISNKGGSSITLMECTFNSNNCTSNIGRAINNTSSDLIINNVMIIDPLIGTGGNSINNQGNVTDVITVQGLTEIKKN
ncbi:MAG: hypothetical protein HKN68_22845, partial [Saprospiraceae bacterium]|nr:hypothetical protein [Saprospiraceae bacterium]